MMERKLLSDGGIIDLYPELLSQTDATDLLDFLIKNVDWEHKYYTNYKTGVKFPQPRLTAWFADDTSMAYTYSGVTQKVQEWLPDLLVLKSKIEKLTQAKYNSVLLNYYRDGKDSVGMHADDEKELGQDPNIASVSLGATRTFVMEHNNNHLKEKYQLTNGSLLVMSGTVQTYWKHSIPKEPLIKEPRINLTFRKFII